MPKTGRGRKSRASQKRRKAIGRLRSKNTKELELPSDAAITGLNPKTSGKKILYTGFKRYETLYVPPCNILIRQPDPDGLPYVAELLSVYQYLDSDEINIVIRWYYRPYDTNLKKSAIPPLQEGEIFASNSLQDDLSAETVERLCFVSFAGNKNPSQSVSKSSCTQTAKNLFCIERTGKAIPGNSDVYSDCSVTDKREKGDDDSDDDEDDVYVCRYFYDVDKKSLVWYEQRPIAALDESANRLIHADTAIKRNYNVKRRGRNKRNSEVLVDRSDTANYDDEDAELDIDGFDEETGDHLSDSTDSFREVAIKRTRSKNSKVIRPLRQHRRRHTRTQPQLRIPKRLSVNGGKITTAMAEKECSTHCRPASFSIPLPCREVEFYEILGFVQSKIEAGSSGCLFVSGVPGTGKTASIRAVANELRALLEAGQVPEFTFVEINGMALSAPQQAYVELWYALSENKDKAVTANDAMALLTQRFTLPSPHRRTVVVLLDEVDQLWTKKQDVLYNMFDWPTHTHSHLILVAAANTMDLPERVFHQRVASRLGLTRLVFMPYTHPQLVQILQSRLDNSSIYDPDAIELCARKVSAVSGDARRALSICQQAADIARSGHVRNCSHPSSTKEPPSNQCSTDVPSPKVSIHHISQAVKEMSSSLLLTALYHAAAQEKLFILATIAACRQTGVEEVTLEQISSFHLHLSHKLGRSTASAASLSLMCTNLANSRYILAEPASLDIRRKVRLNFSAEDALFALQDEPGAKHLIAQEE